MTIKFLHMPLEEIDQFCNEVEQNGEKVMIHINTYKTEPLVNPDGDYYDGSATIDDDNDVLTGGFGQQIHSSKDVIQFDSNNKDD